MTPPGEDPVSRLYRAASAKAAREDGGTSALDSAVLKARLDLPRIIRTEDGPQALGRSMTDLDELRAHLRQFAAATRKVLLSLHSGPIPTPRLLSSSEEADAQMLARGVRLRMVFPTTYLDAEHIPPYVRAMEDRGALVKFADGVPHRLIISDAVRAVVPLDDADLSKGAFTTTSRQLVAGLQALADALYRSGVTLTEIEGGAPVEPPSCFELRLLTMLSSGVPDAVAARRLAVSERTFRRHVTALLKKLGAESRFQAGVRAVERGWL